MLDVRVPIPDAHSGPKSAKTVQAATVYRSLEINTESIAPRDFLSCVCANMELSMDDAQLGWKSCDDGIRTLPKRLREDEDVIQAFNHFRLLLSSARRRKPVFMEVVNLVRSSRF